MSVRKDVNKIVRAGKNGERVLEDATVYVTTKEEALAVDARCFLMASSMTVMEDGSLYLLDADGDRGGKWRSVVDGTELA
jgi:hypothetical protein